MKKIILVLILFSIFMTASINVQAIPTTGDACNPNLGSPNGATGGAVGQIILPPAPVQISYTSQDKQTKTGTYQVGTLPTTVQMPTGVTVSQVYTRTGTGSGVNTIIIGSDGKKYYISSATQKVTPFSDQGFTIPNVPAIAPGKDAAPAADTGDGYFANNFHPSSSSDLPGEKTTMIGKLKITTNSMGDDIARYEKFSKAQNVEFVRTESQSLIVPTTQVAGVSSKFAFNVDSDGNYIMYAKVGDYYEPLQSDGKGNFYDSDGKKIEDVNLGIVKDAVKAYDKAICESEKCTGDQRKDNMGTVKRIAKEFDMLKDANAALRRLGVEVGPQDFAFVDFVSGGKPSWANGWLTAGLKAKVAENPDNANFWTNIYMDGFGAAVCRAWGSSQASDKAAYRDLVAGRMVSGASEGEGFRRATLSLIAVYYNASGDATFDDSKTRYYQFKIKIIPYNKDINYSIVYKIGSRVVKVTTPSYINVSMSDKIVDLYGVSPINVTKYRGWVDYICVRVYNPPIYKFELGTTISYDVSKIYDPNNPSNSVSTLANNVALDNEICTEIIPFNFPTAQEVYANGNCVTCHNTPTSETLPVSDCSDVAEDSAFGFDVSGCTTTP